MSAPKQCRSSKIDAIVPGCLRWLPLHRFASRTNVCKDCWTARGKVTDQLRENHHLLLANVPIPLPVTSALPPLRRGSLDLGLLPVLPPPPSVRPMTPPPLPGLPPPPRPWSPPAKVAPVNPPAKVALVTPTPNVSPVLPPIHMASSVPMPLIPVRVEPTIVEPPPSELPLPGEPSSPEVPPVALVSSGLRVYVPGKRICRQCGVPKDISHYKVNYNPNSADGYFTRCNDCYQSSRPSTASRVATIARQMCVQCKEVRPHTEFYTDVVVCKVCLVNIYNHHFG